MEIDVQIPYGTNQQLAEAYNRALLNGTSEWVLFLDHDVFLCNPRWYTMCLKAVDTLSVDPQAACVGCICGGERLNKEIKIQGDAYVPPNSDIEYHITVAKEHYKVHGNMLQRRNVPPTGFFLLLKRSIAQEIGFVDQHKGINRIDTNFGERLIAAGYHIYTMRGLYVYHRRGMRHLQKDFKIQGE